MDISRIFDLIFKEDPFSRTRAQRVLSYQPILVPWKHSYIIKSIVPENIFKYFKRWIETPFCEAQSIFIKAKKASKL